jgi:RNA polymerase sigma-70 factor, ECF subfamily
VWRQAGRFERWSAVSTWLLAIMRFKALSALRRRKDAELDDEATGAIEDTSDDPEVIVQKKDTGDALRKCLGQLSAEHRRSSIPSTTTRSAWQKWLVSLAFQRIP